MKRSLVTGVPVTGIAFDSVARAFADATSTIDGGSGASQSGRCTGTAADRLEQQVAN